MTSKKVVFPLPLGPTSARKGLRSVRRLQAAESSCLNACKHECALVASNYIRQGFARDRSQFGRASDGKI